MIREREYPALSGWAALGFLLVAVGVSFWQMLQSAMALDDGGSPVRLVAWVIALGLSLFGLAGLFIVNPNEGKVLQLFATSARRRRRGSDGRTRST